MRNRFVAILAILSIVVASCGDGTATTTTTVETTVPTTVVTTTTTPTTTVPSTTTTTTVAPSTTTTTIDPILPENWDRRYVWEGERPAPLGILAEDCGLQDSIMISAVLTDIGILDGTDQYWVEMLMDESIAGIEPLRFVILPSENHTLAVGNGASTGTEVLPCGANSPIDLGYGTRDIGYSDLVSRFQVGRQYVFAVWLGEVCVDSICYFDNTWVPGYINGVNPLGDLMAEIHWWYAPPGNL